MARSPDETSGMVSADELAAELAEAEAVEAEARAAAARAKATAARLRDSAPESGTESDTESDAQVDDVVTDDNPSESGEVPSRGRWRMVGLAAAVIAICGFLTVTGLMVAQHREVLSGHDRDTAILAAAEKGVVALLSIDYNHARADVQRVLDASTGSFRDDFSRDADSFVKTAEESKAVTVGSISAAALEAVDGDTGTVILAVSSRVTNSSGAQQDPRAWRMSVTVTRDGDQLKMSNVEFVP